MASTTSADQRLTCHSCGEPLGPSAQFCQKCGAPVKAAGARPGFGPRYAAFLVDLTIAFPVYLVVSLFVRPLMRLLSIPSGAIEMGGLSGDVSAIAGIPLLPLVALLYFAWGDSRGATPGKKTVGLRVTDRAGGKPGFARALVRSAVIWFPWVMLLSGQIAVVFGSSRGLQIFLVSIGAITLLLVWIGNLVLALSRRGRGFHDAIAKTQIVVGG